MPRQDPQIASLLAAYNRMVSDARQREFEAAGKGSRHARIRTWLGKPHILREPDASVKPEKRAGHRCTSM